MRPVPNWELRLIDFAQAELGRPFIWGETNCVSLALRALDVQLGTAFHAEGRKFMSTALRAAAYAKSKGLADLVTKLKGHGLVEIQTNFQRNGDVKLIQTPETIGAAVIVGKHCLSSSMDEGVRFYTPAEIQFSIVLGARQCPQS